MPITRRTAAAALSAPFLPQSTRPNILLLHCHDLGQHLHTYGVSSVQSPNLDRLAAEGVLFERNFCTAPQCSPSRASIFTGRYPHANGVMGLTHADFAWDLNPGERHLGQILSDAGYATAGVGVIHETRSGPQRCGFHHYLPATPAAEMASAAIAKLNQFARNPNQPFYLQAGCIEPHRLAPKTPNADQDFLGTTLQPDAARGIAIPPFLRNTPGTRVELAELQGAIRHMDAQMGRVLASVRDLHLHSNTLVVFITDHGIAMPRAKASLYEPGLLTSFMVRYPGRDGFHGGIRRKEMVSNVDCLPTLLDLAGIDTPPGLHGKSLAARNYSPRDVIFGEMTYHDYYDPRRSVRTETHKLIVNFSSAPAFMDPSQSWRPRSDTVVPPNHAMAYHPPYELYDLARDPVEHHDLAGDPSQAATLANLRQRLARHLKETNDPILNGAVTSPLHRRAQSWLAPMPDK